MRSPPGITVLGLLLRNVSKPAYKNWFVSADGYPGCVALEEAG